MSTEESSTLPKPFIFVLMPFDKKFDDIYKFGIKGAAKEIGAYAERLDEQIFTEGMLDRIFNQISKADVIVADMTGRNENVFYEVGYSHALGKIVLLLTQDTNDIPFDFKHRQHTVYGGSIDILKTELVAKLQWAIRESKNKAEQESPELFSISILNIKIPRIGLTEEIPTIEAIANNENFTLQIQIRNDSLETSSKISHVYLFCEEATSVIPCEYVTSPTDSFGTTVMIKPFTPLSPFSYSQELASFQANTLDSPDNLTRQFRLQIAFQPLPPGAVEVDNLNLMFTKKNTKVDSRYRLRLHSETKFHDYPFRLKIELKKEPSKQKE